MGAVARKTALEQDEAVDCEGARRKGGLLPLEITRRSRATAVVTGQRDVRVEGPVFGLETRLDARPIDFRGKFGNGLSRFDVGPDGAPASAIEPADAARGSLRLSITITAPSGQSSIALRCGWDRSVNTLIGFRSSRAGM